MAHLPQGSGGIGATVNRGGVLGLGGGEVAVGVTAVKIAPTLLGGSRLRWPGVRCCEGRKNGWKKTPIDHSMVAGWGVEARRSRRREDYRGIR